MAPPLSQHYHGLVTVARLARDDNNNNNNNNSSSKQPQQRRGYRFGDLTRRFVGDRVNQLTGKEEYEFGDLSRFVDSRIKSRINQVTGKGDSDEYEFGDLTGWALQQAQNATLQYTGKESYQVGDLSKEVLRRVQAGEYEAEDVWLACRILLSVGIGTLSPVASLLPIRYLLELVNLGLAQEASGRLVGVLAEFLDRRVKHALTGNEQYQLGDLTKQRLLDAITSWTGQPDYQVGDIVKTVQKRAASTSSSDDAASSKKVAPELKMEENPNDVDTNNRYYLLKSELEEIKRHQAKGTIIRSRCTWVDEGEKNSAYF